MIPFPVRIIKSYVAEAQSSSLAALFTLAKVKILLKPTQMCGAQVNILKYVISSMIVAIKVIEVNYTSVFLTYFYFSSYLHL